MTSYSFKIPRWQSALMLIFAIVFVYIWIKSTYQIKSTEFVLLGALIGAVGIGILIYMLVTGKQPMTIVQNK